MTKEAQDKITHDVVGSSMEVHSIMGNAFQEVVYQGHYRLRCTCEELNINANLKCLYYTKVRM